jgi:hypothetical protein
MSSRRKKEVFPSALRHPILMPTRITNLVSVGPEERELAHYLVMKLSKLVVPHHVRHLDLIFYPLLEIFCLLTAFLYLQAAILPVSKIS